MTVWDIEAFLCGAAGAAEEPAQCQSASQGGYRLAAPWRSRSTAAAPAEVEADLVCVALAEGGALPAEIAAARGAADAKPGFKKLALIHPERPARALVVGLGDATRSTPSACGWPRPSPQARGEPRRELARVGAPRRPRSRRGRRRPRRGHGPRLLPIRPLPLRRRRRPGAARAPGAPRPGEPTARRSKPPRDLARVGAEAANRARSFRICPRTSSPRARWPSGRPRSRPPTSALEAEILDREAIAAAGHGRPRRRVRRAPPPSRG